MATNYDYEHEYEHEYVQIESQNVNANVNVKDELEYDDDMEDMKVNIFEEYQPVSDKIKSYKDITKEMSVMDLKMTLENFVQKEYEISCKILYIKTELQNRWELFHIEKLQMYMDECDIWEIDAYGNITDNMKYIKNKIDKMQIEEHIKKYEKYLLERITETNYPYVHSYCTKLITKIHELYI